MFYRKRKSQSTRVNLNLRTHSIYRIEPLTIIHPVLSCQGCGEVLTFKHCNKCSIPGKCSEAQLRFPSAVLSVVTHVGVNRSLNKGQCCSQWSICQRNSLNLWTDLIQITTCSSLGTLEPSQVIMNTAKMDHNSGQSCSVFQFHLFDFDICITCA